MATLAPGAVVDGYVIEQQLGRGGMAVVYRVRHADLLTEHALKVLQLPLGAIQQRLLQEGRIQAQLRHPNIVAVTDTIKVGGAPGLVMEYVDGPDLAQILESRELTLAQIDELVEGILAGVGRAHELGSVHRDLKPANILLSVSADGIVPKVADFGLAKLLTEDDAGPAGTRTGTAMGTPFYMSPEQVRDAKDVDQRTDIWALGCILFELVTGTRPFGGESTFDIFENIARAPVPSARARRPDLPDRMDKAIAGALVKDRSARFVDCSALLAAWRGEQQPAVVARTPGGAWQTAELESLAGLRAPASGFDPAPLEAVGSPATLGGTWSEDVPAAVASETLDFGETFDAPSFDASIEGVGAESEPIELRSSAEVVPAGRGWIAPALGAVAVGLMAVAFVLWSRPPTPASAPEPVSLERAEPAPVPGPVPRDRPEEAKSGKRVSPVSPAVDKPVVVKPSKSSKLSTSRKPEPSEAEAETGTVVVEGPAEVSLVRDGVTHGPGEVPAGTYTVRYAFPGKLSKTLKAVVVGAGVQTTIVCDASFGRCKIGD